jgi:hypothetical protein
VLLAVAAATPTTSRRNVRVLDLTPDKISVAASELSKMENVVEIRETHSSGAMLISVYY